MGWGPADPSSITWDPARPSGGGYREAPEAPIPRALALAALLVLPLLACTQDSPAPQEGEARALQFDGVDDYVALPSHPRLPATGWTLEAWIKPAASAQDRPNIAAMRSEGGGAESVTFRIRRDFGSVLELGLASRGHTWGMAGAHPIPVDRWTHVAVSWEASGSLIRLYVDGELDLEQVSPIPAQVGPAPLWLGGDPLHGPTKRPFAGSIGELRLWDHARPQEGISAGRVAPLRGDEPGLELYWSAQGSEGGRLTDRGPHGLHGSLGAGQPAHSPRWVVDGPY
jgi:hypothetical protein